MNELFKINETEEQITISARELHKQLESGERFSKWFDRFSQYGFVNGEDYTPVPNGTPVQGGNGNIQYLNDYQVTLDMAKEIAMLQRTEQGKVIRKKLIELEKAWNSPEKIMARALSFAKKEIASLSIELEEARPKIAFADAVATSQTSILVGELAKILRQNGIEMGQMRLFGWLRDNGYLIKRKGSDWNMPTQRSMEMGLFEIKESSHVNGAGVSITTKTPKVTGKGHMSRPGLTDEQVEREIERLTNSREVQLARKKQRIDYRRRQYLYKLRNMEKKGKELLEAGIDEEVLDRMAEEECEV